MLRVAIISFCALLTARLVGQDKQLKPLAGEGRKMALVIGNASYPIAKLKNPLNDSDAMRKALAAKGFSVWPCCDDVGLKQMRRAVDDWTGSLRPNDMAIFYYSGHGMRIDAKDYLIPIDFSNADTSADVEYEAYSVQRLQEKMLERGTRVNIIILDACRSNPFSVVKDLSSGLAPISAGFGTYIFFAAGEGKTADDNDRETYSLFTKVLLDKLSVPSISLIDLGTQVKQGVYEASNHKQIPYVSENTIFAITLADISTSAQARTPNIALVQNLAKIAGRVINAAGLPVAGAEVRLTTDRTVGPQNRTYPYKFLTDANGDYRGSGIAPAHYVVLVYQQNTSVDFSDDVALIAGEERLLNFDMTRKEYVDALTPEARQKLEEYKARYADTIAGNASISSINALLTQAREDTRQGNYTAAISAMQTATTAKPGEPILWDALGDAQLGLADAAAKSARAANTSPTEKSITQKYIKAAESYQRAIDLNAAAQHPSEALAGAAYNQLGQAKAKAEDATGSILAYDEAAKQNPQSAGMYYYNEAATLYNAGMLAEAAVAADKAISADPNKADAYYVKGQSLIPKAVVDPRTHKIIAPAGCVKAYQTYLALAPAGPHAGDVREILTGIGARLTN